MSKDNKILENNIIDDDLLEDVAGGKNIGKNETLVQKGKKSKATNTLMNGNSVLKTNLLYKDTTDTKSMIDGIEFEDAPKKC